MRQALKKAVRELGSWLAAASVFALLAPLAASAGTLSTWYPAGYKTDARYPGIAARWDWHPHCAYGASCMGLYVVSRRGCPNGLYAELNIISRGAVVSYTNDELGSLRPRQIGRLTFDVYDLPRGATGQLTKIDCL